MRVLHLLGAEEDSGGILSVLRALQTVTAGQGWEHVVWVHQSYRETRRPALAYRQSRFLLAQLPSHGEMFFRGLRALGELKTLLKQESFDVLHAHTRGALVVALGVVLLWRRPILFTNHAYARRVGLYRWAARRARMHTSVLTPNMARYYRLTPGAPRLHVISECCADAFLSAPLVARRPPLDPRAPLRLVGLGNILRWKNWHLLVEALHRLSPEERERVQFHHWGTTPPDAEAQAYERGLRALVAERGLTPTCFFHGLSLSVAAVLREADWFVLPSTNEPCSVALIEALALGVPAIASASGGNVDIIRPGVTGLLFEPERVADLTNKLREVLAGRVSPGTPEEVRQSVQGRTASIVAREYLQVYEAIRSRGAPQLGSRAAAWA